MSFISNTKLSISPLSSYSYVTISNFFDAFDSVPYDLSSLSKSKGNIFGLSFFDWIYSPYSIMLNTDELLVKFYRLTLAKQLSSTKGEAYVIL